MITSKLYKTLAYRNKNPLNIRYSSKVKWQGQLDNIQGFVRFSGFSYGYRAAVKILRSYHLRGIRSIGKIIETWAPQTENNTAAYTKSVLSYLNGVFAVEQKEYCARTQINLRDREEVVNLLMAMTRVETGANVAQLHDFKSSAYAGYDLAVTSQGFFDYEIIDNC
jgi:hypothetical protein